MILQVPTAKTAKPKKAHKPTPIHTTVVNSLSDEEAEPSSSAAAASSSSAAAAPAKANAGAEQVHVHSTTGPPPKPTGDIAMYKLVAELATAYKDGLITDPEDLEEYEKIMKDKKIQRGGKLREIYKPVHMGHYGRHI